MVCLVYDAALVAIMQHARINTSLIIISCESERQKITVGQWERRLDHDVSVGCMARPTAPERERPFAVESLCKCKS